MTSATSFSVAGVSGIIQNLDYTGGQTFDTYLATVSIVKAAAQKSTALTATEVSNLRDALDVLKSVFSNGLQDPSTGRITYLTQELATPLASLFNTLQIAGIDPTGNTITYPSPGDVSAVTTALNTWRSTVYNTPLLNALFTTASTASNRSMQSMTELDYVSTGNDVMASQMESLQTALDLTKTVLATMGDLQSIHNQVDVLSKGTFNGMPSTSLSDDDFIAAYKTAASTFFGTPIVPGTNFSPGDPGYELATIPAGGALPIPKQVQDNNIGTYGSVVLNGANGINSMLSQHLSPGATGQFPAGSVWSFTPNGDFQYQSGGTSGAVTAQVKLEGSADWFSPGLNPFVQAIGGLPIKFFPVPNFASGDTVPYIHTFLQTASGDHTGQFGKAFLRLPSIDSTQEFPIYYIIPNQNNDWSAGSLSAISDIQRVRRVFTALTAISSAEFSLSTSYKGVPPSADNAIFEVFDPFFTDVLPGLQPTVNPYSVVVGDAGFSTQQKITVPANFSSNLVWLTQSITTPFGDPFHNPFTVNTTKDPQAALNIRNTLANAFTKLDAVIAQLTASGASSDPSSLLTNLKQVRADMAESLIINGSPITTSTSLQDCVVPIQKWLVDRYDLRGTADAAKAGLYQQNITTAIAAGQSINTSQQEKVRNFLYIFQEYYKSASAVLQQLTQIIQRMGQGINR